MKRAFLHNEERVFFFVFLWFQLTSLYPVTHCPSLIKLFPVRCSSPWGRLGGVIPFGEGTGVRLVVDGGEAFYQRLNISKNEASRQREITELTPSI